MFVYARRARWELALLLALLLSGIPASVPTPARAQTTPAYKRLTMVTGEPAGTNGRDAMAPRVAFNPFDQRYLLAFISDAKPLTNDDYQVFVQLLTSGLSFRDPNGTMSNDPNPTRVSVTGTRRDPTADRSRDPVDSLWRASVAANSVSGGFLVAYPGSQIRSAGGDEHEIYARILDPLGQPISGTVELQVSNQGPPGDVTFDADGVAVAFNPLAAGGVGEYLIVWHGDVGGTVDNHEYETMGRRIGANGVPVGAPFQISNWGPPGNPNYDTAIPTVVVNSSNGDYLVAYPASTQVFEQEIYATILRSDGTTRVAQIRVSDMGPDGDGNYDAYQPGAIYNPDSAEYLIVFPGSDLVLGETEIYGQRLSADGGAVGLNDFRISDTGSYGSPIYDAFNPSVDYSTASREYLVSWQADDTFDGDREIFAQRLNPLGEEVGIDDRRLSFHGPPDNSNFRAGHTIVATSSAENDQYAVFWSSDDGGRDDLLDFGLRPGEYEIFGQLITISPTVLDVTSVPPTSNNLLEEIEGINAEVTALSARFSKPMGDPAGDTTLGDVTNPASYRLIEAGRDKIVETADCGALQGDDKADFAIAQASYSSATRAATLTPGQTLGAGFYRLILCPVLQDERGRPLDGNGDGAPQDPFIRNFSVLSAAATPWLVLLYLAGDDIDPQALKEKKTSLEVSLTEPLLRLLGRLDRMPYNPNLRIVALYDGNQEGDSRIYVRERDGLVDKTNEAAQSSLWLGGIPSNREIDTGSIATLQNFIRWSRITYPGSLNSMLSVVDHGGGWAPDLDSDGAQPRGRNTVQVGGWRGMSLDLGSSGGTSFSTRDTSRALKELGALGKFDLIFFDACLMGMVESAYEILPYTDYYLAGQNLLWSELPYEDYLSAQGLTAGTSAAQLAEHIVTRYNIEAPRSQPFTIAAVRSSGLADVVGLANALGQYMLDELRAGGTRATQAEQLIREAYKNAQKFDYDASFAIDLTDGYVDLADFAFQLSTVELTFAGQPTQLPETLRKNADTLYQLITSGVGTKPKAVLAQRTVSGQLTVAGKSVTWSFPKARGLSIYLPLGEQDIRLTRFADDDDQTPEPERQLNYYTDADQLAFTRDAGTWAGLLEALEAGTPLRNTDRDYNSPFPLAEQRLFLPLLRK